MRTRDDVWLDLDRNFKKFMDTLGRLTEEELTSQPVVGKWTVKDVVAHLWSRVDEAIMTAKSWTGKRAWETGVTFDDARNESQVADRSLLPLITTMDGLTGAHRRLINLLDLVEDDVLQAKGKDPRDGVDKPLIDYLYSIAEHYSEHTTSIKEYQERCLNGCD